MFSQKSFLKFIFSVTIVLTGLVFFAHPVSAVPINVIENIAKQPDLNLPRYDSFSAFLKDFIQMLLALVFLVVVVFMVISGYRMIASAGNEEAATKAKSGLTWAVAGAVVVVLAWVIVRAIITLLESGNAGTGLGLPPA